MPCLNEAETLATCIRKAQEGLKINNITGEIVIADNGSADGSQKIAADLGARVVNVERKGYGSALIGGIQAARGKYVIMGDADDSYDFLAIAPFMDKLRSGHDLVMGNRFKGGIADGAMPFLHRYLGNPVLSWLGRLFFGISVRDFHCGLRGFNRERILGLNLRTTGMEFASEMVVRAALEGYSMTEVPTTLSPDGRSRPPHLRTWRDGWRHLSFLLMYSPKWIFLYPGLFLLLAGLVLSTVLFPGQVQIGGVGFDIHTFIVASFSLVLGTQAIGFAVFARRFATSHKLMPPSEKRNEIIQFFTLERVLIAAGFFIIFGLIGLFVCLFQWASSGFGPLEYTSILRILILSMTAITIGIQSALMAFFASITEIPTK
ncbi:glycosyltransferase family 2 protein [Brucella anthropi]|nr:glycosyltransferase family 2 protein [Brucella anthropi]